MNTVESRAAQIIDFTSMKPFEAIKDTKSAPAFSKERTIIDNGWLVMNKNSVISATKVQEEKEIAATFTTCKNLSLYQTLNSLTENLSLLFLSQLEGKDNADMTINVYLQANENYSVLFHSG